MQAIGTIAKFKTANFTVIVDAVEEDSPDLSWDEDGSTRAGLESGRYILFCARARVVHEDFGMLAEDYLGGCVYESLEDFRKSTGTVTYPDGTVRKGGYCGDMVHEVCRSARQRLIKMRATVTGLRIRE